MWLRTSAIPLTSSIAARFFSCSPQVSCNQHTHIPNHRVIMVVGGMLYLCMFVYVCKYVCIHICIYTSPAQTYGSDEALLVTTRGTGYGGRRPSPLRSTTPRSAQVLRVSVCLFVSLSVLVHTHIHTGIRQIIAIIIRLHAAVLMQSSLSVCGQLCPADEQAWRPLQFLSNG